jgi:hypothetical protein
VPAIAGAAIMGFVFLMFAANYFLTILESSGVGSKEVTWYSEPILDNAWKVVYFGWLMGLWCAPAYFLSRVMLTGHPSIWHKMAIPLLVVWVGYPISQLSSLSTTSIWLPIVPDVFVRLLQRPLVTLSFFALSLLNLALFAVGLKWAFLTKEEWEYLFIGSPIMVLTLFVYARLIGRLAFGLRFTRGLFEPREKKPKAEKKDAEATRSPRQTEERDEPRFTQPSELPPIQTADEEDSTGYDVLIKDDPLPSVMKKKRLKAEAVEPEPERVEAPGAEPTFSLEPDPPPAKPKRKRKPAPASAVERSREWSDEDDEETTAYGVHEAEVIPEETTPKEVVKPREEEMRLLRRDDRAKPPKQLWGPDLLAFLVHPGTISAFLIATFLCTAAGTMVRIARYFNPIEDASPD